MHAMTTPPGTGPGLTGRRRRPGRAPDDAHLLAAARTGDAAAFTALVRRHDDRARALAWSLLRDPAAMDDALQEAYLKAWRSLVGFRGDAAFGTWLHRIVRNTCLDHLRRRRPTVALVDDGPHDDPDAAWRAPAGGLRDERAPAPDAAGERMAVADALATLDPDTRLALVLVDRDGHPYDEVAELLGVPVGTVASRLHRGRRALRAALAEPQTDTADDDARGGRR